MSATILPEKTFHQPVLLNEVIDIITPQNGGTFIDCTFGQGGYSKKILEYPNTKVIAIDRDKNSKHVALDLKKKFGDRFSFHNIKFSQIKDLNIKDEIKDYGLDIDVVVEAKAKELAFMNEKYKKVLTEVLPC